MVRTIYEHDVFSFRYMKYFVLILSLIVTVGIIATNLAFAQYMGGNDTLALEERIGVGLTREITWPPPIKQIKLFEFEPENVKCNSDLVLILKYDGSPACVKPETKQKLIQRGWTNEFKVNSEKHVEISLIEFVHGQIVNEPITDFTIKLEGYGYNTHAPDLAIKTDEDKVIWTNPNFYLKSFGRSQPGYFCTEYNFNEIGGPVILNSTGYYYLIVNFDNAGDLTQGFSVREERVSGGNIPSFGNHCDAGTNEQISVSEQIKIQRLSENEIVSQGIGFDLPKDTFTKEDLNQLQEREKTLKKIMADPGSSKEKSELASKEYSEMQIRLQNPFQTGVPYELAKILREKMLLRGTLLDNRDQYSGEYPEPAGAWHKSDKHQAIIIFIKDEYFTSPLIEKYDAFVREFLGNEVNLVYRS